MRRPATSLNRNQYFVIGLVLGLVLSFYIPQDIWELVQQEECPQEAAENLLIERFGQDFEPHLNLINKPLAAKKPAYHFDRADVSSPGIHKFFLQASAEEREHAEKIMTYMNKRGGLIRLSSIPEPLPCFKDIMEALKYALKMELEVNQHLLDVHALAGSENDPNLCDFIEANFLQEQVDGQKVLADLIRQLERAKTDVGDYLFDKYIASNSSGGGGGGGGGAMHANKGNRR